MYVFAPVWIMFAVVFYAVIKLLPGTQLRGTLATLFLSAAFGLTMSWLGALIFAAFASSLGLAYVVSALAWWLGGALAIMLAERTSRALILNGDKLALAASAIIAVVGLMGAWCINALAMV